MKNTKNVQNISISLIDPYPGHPFKVIDDEKMVELTKSILANGLIFPVYIRPKANARFEMVSGHRRLGATQLSGQKTIKAIVHNFDNDTATFILVESNLNQRKTILPSEKAFAYQMLYEARKHQGKRTDLTSSPLETKLRTDDELAYQVGESREQIHRFIRLTKLVPELLEYMDKGKMALRPAVELSYLDEDCQRDILDFIDENECFPSHAQTIRMRRLFESNELNTQTIFQIMSELKPNQKEKIFLHAEKVRKLIPKSIPLEKTEDYICKALKHYTMHLQKTKAT